MDNPCQTHVWPVTLVTLVTHRVTSPENVGEEVEPKMYQIQTACCIEKFSRDLPKINCVT